jgi:hypothetical protein
MVVSGCAQTVPGTAEDKNASQGASASSAPPPSAPQAPEQSSPSGTDSVDLASLQGTWRGKYSCAQGETGMELKVGAPEGETVPAVFRFFPLPDGPQVPSGSFSMKGANTETGLVFKQQAWIDKPKNFHMVDLGVAAVQGDTMTGRVAAAGCGDFAVTRE